MNGPDVGAEKLQPCNDMREALIFVDATAETIILFTAILQFCSMRCAAAVPSNRTVGAACPLVGLNWILLIVVILLLTASLVVGRSHIHGSDVEAG
jgi:hypothetical protein